MLLAVMHLLRPVKEHMDCSGQLLVIDSDALVTNSFLSPGGNALATICEGTHG